jgi:hypothetical protein
MIGRARQCEGEQMEEVGVAGCEALYCTMMVGPKKTRDGGGDGDGKGRGGGRGRFRR